MTTNTNQLFIWLKEFQYTWLPQHITNNTRLFKLITDKLRELEHLLAQNNQNVTISDDEYPFTQTNDTEEVVLLPSVEQQSECLSLTPPDIQNRTDSVTQKSYRPAIRIKRIPLIEAEQFLPPGWKPQPKRGRKKGKKKILKKRTNTNTNRNKKNTQTNKAPLASTPDEVANTSITPQRFTRSKNSIQQTPLSSSLTSTPSTSDNRKKGKRKLRATIGEDDDLYTLGNLSQTEHTNGNNDCEQIPRYMGQNGILSQTRKTNDTTIDDDFTIKLQSRQSNKNKTLLSEPIAMPSEVGSMDDEHSFQEFTLNNDHESLFASLDVPFDKTVETNPILNNNSIINYNDCIEDISNDGIEPSTSSPNLGQFYLTT